MTRGTLLTDLTKKWLEYARKFYGDGAGDPALQAKDTEQLEQIIASGLAALAPDIPEETIESVARQIAGKLVDAALPELAGSGPSPDLTDDEWVEDTVQKIADRLLAEGESGIDTAVVTDDLRQCLYKLLAADMPRLDALYLCQTTAWIDEAVYWAQKDLEAAGLSEDEALDRSLAFGDCLRRYWAENKSNPDAALAFCRDLLDTSATPLPAPEDTPTPVPGPQATPAVTPAPTPCQNQTDGTGDLDDVTECHASPAPTPTCAAYDPLCGLRQ